MGVTGFTKPFSIGIMTTAMANISPFANWIEGTTANITKIKENTQIKSISGYVWFKCSKIRSIRIMNRWFLEIISAMLG